MKIAIEHDSSTAPYDQLRQQIIEQVHGGGLIAGIAAYVKQQRPGVRIIGVEADEAPSMYRALKEGRRVALAEEMIDAAVELHLVL